jgi:hypothetical protein
VLDWSESILMANQGAKRRLETNQKRMHYLQIALLVSFGLFVLVRLLILWSRSTIWHYVGFSVVAATCWFCYSSIWQMAQPIYDGDELIDGGSDLSMTGLVGYYHDWLYISCFVLFTSSLSNLFWWTYTVVPLYGIYQLIVNVVAPMLARSSASSQQDLSQMDPATRKRLAKAEARSERRQAKSAGRR